MNRNWVTGAVYFHITRDESWLRMDGFWLAPSGTTYGDGWATPVDMLLITPAVT